VPPALVHIQQTVFRVPIHWFHSTPFHFSPSSPSLTFGLIEQSLSAGSCVSTCPIGSYPDSQMVCQRRKSHTHTYFETLNERVIHPFLSFFLACNSNCLSCTGPSYQECTACNTASSFPYLDGTNCVNRCDNFEYAPSGTYVCQGKILSFFPSKREFRRSRNL